MKGEFSIVVVIFKTAVSQSPTIRSLRTISSSIPFELTLWDNSPTPQPADELNYLEKTIPGLTYVHTPENISLAAVYNSVIEKSPNTGLFMILDQDSEFDQSLLDLASKAAKENPGIDIFIPYVRNANTIFSPGRHNYIKGKYLAEIVPGKMKALNTVAVASGMIIRMKYLKDNFPPFDQRLKLYGIDTDFMLSHGERKSELFVLDYNLNHGLSINEVEPLSSKLWRFNDMRSAMLLISRKRSALHNLVARVYLAYTALKLCLQYRTLKFVLN